MYKWWSSRTIAVKFRKAKSVLHYYHDVEDKYEGLTVNPYTGCSHRCVYCYATFEWREDFHDLVEVKFNADSVLRRELATWKKPVLEPVFLSTATDPYQPIEGVYRITRRVIEVLQSKGVPYYVFTKSATIVRDLDLHARYKDKCAIVWSLTTIDDNVKRIIEPGASSAKGVLEAIRRFSEAGVLVGVNIDPIIPGLTDGEGQIKSLVEEAAKRGARFVDNGVLRLRDDIWRRLRELLLRYGFKKAYRTIERLYFDKGRRSGPYRLPPESYISRIEELVKEEAEKNNVYYGIPVGENEAVEPVRLWETKPLSCYLQPET